MSVHDHHNDPNDPVNQPGKRSRPIDPARGPVDSLDRRGASQGMGPGAWVAGIVLLLALIGGVIYSMSDRTTTATNAPAGSSAPSTTGTGAGTTPSAAPSPTTPPASPAPAR